MNLSVDKVVVILLSIFVFANGVASPCSSSYCSSCSSCSAPASSTANPDNLVPITKIPDTNLFTGIFYKIVLKGLPQGFVTWANKGKYYVQVELNPNELPKYETGREYQFDHQWIFGATESNIGYTLTNRAKPHGNLIWASATVGHGHHVAIYDEEVARAKMSEGGEWRKDASWIVQPTDEKDYYKIENLAKRQNYLTWTWTKHNDFNYYVQLCKDFVEDSKFSFRPSGIKFDVNIYDFEFSRSFESFLNDNESDFGVEATKRLSNPNDVEIILTLEETVNTNDSVTISFKESMAMVDKTTLSINVLEAIGGKEFSFQGGFEANVERRAEIAKTTSIEKQITIAPRKNVEACIFTVWAKNVELPFTAKMKIDGRAERMVVGHPDEVREESIPIEVLEEFIKSQGGEKLEFVSQSGVSYVRVSGVLKGNFGIKTILKTKVSDYVAVECGFENNHKNSFLSGEEI